MFMNKMENNSKDWIQEFFKLLTANEISRGQTLKFQHLPGSLFKYREFDQDGYAIRNFLNDSLWVSSADKLNDPYDSFFRLCEQRLEAKVWPQTQDHIKEYLSKVQGDPIVATEDVDKSSSLSSLTECASKKNANITPGLIDALNKVWTGIWGDFFINKLRPKIQVGMGVCSLSEINTSMIMWRYYGGNHSGFCVEYDLVATKTEHPNLIHAVYPVNYVDELSDMTELFISKDIGVAALTGAIAALHKSSEWSYEKEWRFIFPFGSSQIPFNMIAPRVKAIYLGMKINDKNKNLIIKIAKQKKIAVYEAHFLSQSYQLGFQRIDI